MHVYVFMKAKTAFALGARRKFFLFFLMTIMMFMPIVIRLTEKTDHECLARFFSYMGYSWAGCLFLFLSAGILVDFYRLSVYVIGLILKRNFVILLPSPRTCFMLPLISSLAISSYGYFEAVHIHTEKIVIKTPKISKDVGVLRIVQVSDVHLGLIVREARLGRILEAVKNADADIFISTGDLLDGQTNHISTLAEPLEKIRPRYGKYAIMGNHEFYAGLPQALEFTQKAGFAILRGEGVTPAGLINLAGVDDPAGKNFGHYLYIPEKELLSALPRDKFTILLKHLPIVEEGALGLFDLQISGHTHKGQIFPFSLITRIFFPHNAGLFNLQDGSNLYVSRGTGTWGPPFRFLSRPEVTVYELIHSDD